MVKVLGDSLTVGGYLYGSIDTVFSGYDLEVNAQGGRTTPGGAWLVDNGALRLGDDPAVVVIALGTNDAYTTCYGGLVEHVTQSVLRVAPDAKVLWVGPAQWSAAMAPIRADLVAWHDGDRRVFLDWDPYVRSYPAWLASDGVHLTADGYWQRNLVVEGEVSALLAQP